MSKAFTRDDDDGGFLPPPSRKRGRARLTAYGARLLREASSSLLDGAEIVPPARGDVVALGACVRFRGARGDREVVLVSADEVGHVPHGIAIAAPIARALLGARVGDIVSVEAPREEELTVLAVDWPT